MLKHLLITCLLFGFLSTAKAHDPGLSRSNVKLQNTNMTMHMVFVRQDIENLVSIDTDYDGRVTADEFSVAQPLLLAAMKTGVELRNEGERLLPKTAQVELTSDDTINVELYYAYSQASLIDIQVPLLAQLASGHRQYLTVHDINGQLLSQHLLDADSTAFSVQAPGLDAHAVLKIFMIEGVWHIWIGFDHILFLLTLLLPAVLVYRNSGWTARQELRPAITDTFKVVTAFTLAHSITLTLTVLDIITPPRLVESIIAFSVLVTAVNNLRPIFTSSRWLLAFGFGLIHGFGFAGVLLELGLPDEALLLSLLGFNLGVEAGQLAIVLMVFPVAAALRYTRLYRIWIFSGGSTVAAVIAMIWMVERI